MLEQNENILRHPYAPLLQKLYERMINQNHRAKEGKREKSIQESRGFTTREKDKKGNSQNAGAGRSPAHAPH